MLETCSLLYITEIFAIVMSQTTDSNQAYEKSNIKKRLKNHIFISENFSILFSNWIK